MTTLDLDAPATLEEALARDAAPVEDEVSILVRISRANLRALTDGGVPCGRVALKECHDDAPDPVGVYRILAEGDENFRDALPVRR